MAEHTKISWATDSFNTHWGCVEVSPACDSCYARTFSKRLGMDIWGKSKPRRFFGDKHWNEPRNWDRIAAKTGQRRRIFVNSMSDTFEGRRDLDPVRERLWNLIKECPNCDFLLLTKRPENIRRMLPAGWLEKPMPNVWLGTTAENQRRADERIPVLLSVPAAVHWVSAEPLLEAIDLEPYFDWTDEDFSDGFPVHRKGLDWVIIGGESGAGARPMNLEWAESLVAQCRKAEVAPFVKQLGGYPNKRGELDTFPETLRIREFPTVHAVGHGS